MANLTDLERKKLELEIDVLKDRLDEVEKKNKKPTFKDLISKNFKFLTSTILIIISIFGGLYTLYKQSSEYIEERKNENELRIDVEMLNLIPDLQSPNAYTRDYASWLLVQHKQHAVPIFSYYLRYNTEEKDYKFVLNLLKSVKRKSDPEKFNMALLNVSDDLFRETVLNCLSDINVDEKVTSLTYHFDLIEELCSENQDEVNSFKSNWNKQLSDDSTTLKENCSDNFEIISDYLK